jgi:hypothetical protein
LKIEYSVRDVSVYSGNDGSIDLTVTGGVQLYTYLWSNGSDSEDLDSLTAGIYSVTVNDAVDSTASDTIVVTQPDKDPKIYDVDGNEYAIVVIGNQTWMAENLGVTKASDGTPVTSYCYGDNPDHEQTYGLLYTWDGAMNGSVVDMAQGICPSGWHIPSDEEVKILEMTLGMTQKEADMENAWRRCLRDFDTGVGRWNTFPKTYGMSIRCIKNNSD